MLRLTVNIVINLNARSPQIVFWHNRSWIFLIFNTIQRSSPLWIKALHFCGSEDWGDSSGESSPELFAWASVEPAGEKSTPLGTFSNHKQAYEETKLEPKLIMDF